MPKTHPDHHPRLQKVILSAARHRYLTWSSAKTTLEEIAGDCAITAPHLYNFYKNKLVLAEAVAVSLLVDRNQITSELLKTDGDARDILRAYFEREVELTIDAATTHPGYIPLMALVREKRGPSFSRSQRKYLRPLSLYLDQAMERGEVVRHDPFWLAETLHLATHAFRNEFVTGDLRLSDLKTQLTDVISLLLEGVMTKKEPSAGKAEG